MDLFEEEMEKARRFYQRGQYQLALDFLQRLRQQCAQTVESWQADELSGRCWHALGELEKARIFLWKAIESCTGPYLHHQQLMYSNYLFLLHYLPNVTASELAQQHFMYDRLYATTQQFTHQKRDKTKLRIGYLSPDFNEHVDIFFAIQLLACYDKDRFEVRCYSLAQEEDETTEQLKELVDGWCSLVGMSEFEAARRIYEDGIDILVDLSGHAKGGQTLIIAGYKPAPVQVCGIGYMSTTGMHAMDYFLTDIYCDPIGMNDNTFSEKLVRLPQTHLCYTPSEQMWRSSFEYRPHKEIIFGSFNKFNKVTDNMLQLWLRILQRVPGSRLLLKNTTESRHPLARMQERLRQAGFADGQVELRTGSGNYWQEYMDVDIALDTYPYPGGATTCEALYMGVPVVSLYGERHGSRFGFSLLQNIGLGELAAHDEEDYINIAVGLAGERERLQGLHGEIRRMLQMSALMDGKRYTAAVEKAYEAMWQKWLEQ